jgi:hypothetical protein
MGGVAEVDVRTTGIGGASVSIHLPKTVGVIVCHHISYVDVELLPPFLDLPFLCRKNDLGETVGVFEDRHATDDCSGDRDVVLEGGFAIAKELTPHDPGSVPARSEAGGGLLVHDP